MRVLITDCNFPSFDAERRVLEPAGHEIVTARCATADEVVARAADADALLVQYAPLTEAVMAALAGRCRVIVRYGSGVDNLDLDAAGKHGIPVCNVPDYGADEVADHTAAMALALFRQLPAIDALVRAGGWSGTSPLPLRPCQESTFVVLGVGRIGRATLERMRPFGFRLAACSARGRADELRAAGIEPLGLDEAIARADVLSLHLRLTPETHHLMNAARFRAMKNTAIVVNTARGALMDTRALAAALQSGEIAYAGLDVFEEEPLAADHPLRACPNALLSHHVAYYSSASLARLQRLAAEEVLRAFNGQPLRCRVR
jgi:D-3-phosphoglycerate dehydrogenase